MKLHQVLVLTAAALLALVALNACPAANVECKTDSDCDGNDVCDDDTCVQCIVDRDCDAGETCNSRNECVADGNEGEGEGDAGEGEGDAGEGEGEGEAEICNDGVDNDGNNFIDCTDFACDSSPDCVENCGNTVDDDGDGRVDCADGGCASSPLCAPVTHLIQDVEDGTVAEQASVILENVVVTGAELNAGNQNHSLFVEEPNGVTTSAHTYPEFAGLGVFVPAVQSSTFPDVNGIAVGDCITLAGKVGEFNGQTQLANLTTFHLDTGCGASPAPSSRTLAELQPGVLAETFEGVLVTVFDVEASDASVSGDFTIDDTLGNSLFVSNFLMSSEPVVAPFDQFSSITGVLSEFTVNGNVRYQLQPRFDTELVRP